MKYKRILLIATICFLGLISFNNKTISADETNSSITEENIMLSSDNSEKSVISYIDEDGNYVVREYSMDINTEDNTSSNSKRKKRSANPPVNMGSPIISRWGSWEYTHIAISTGVLSNAINHALYNGIGVSLGMFGIPGWALGGMLDLASWTKRGSKPGDDIAKLWDKNKNGWVGFYVRKGYDAAGRVVATEYSTR